MKRGGLIVPKKKLVDTTFSHSSYFGAIDSSSIPDFYFVVAEPLEIKDQQDSDMCTAYATSEVAEDAFGITFEPSYIFSRMKKILGDYTGFGADPDTACQAACQFGFLPESSAPFNLQSKGREFVANPNNWDPQYDVEAAKYQDTCYFKVDGQNDLFDSIRATLWQNKDEKRSIFVGAYWQNEWDTPIQSAPGVISAHSGNLIENAHAFKIFGQKPINGTMYVIAQLSNGKSFGDNGLFYFPREVVNNFLFARIFKKADPVQVKQIQWSVLQKVYNYIINLIEKIKKNVSLLSQA